MRERIYITVADYCLIETIKKLDDSGCDGIGLGKVDDKWLVSYYKEPVECYQDASPSNQNDELAKEAEEYIDMQRNLMISKGTMRLKESENA